MNILLSIQDDHNFEQSQAFQRALQNHRVINWLDGQDHSQELDNIDYAVVWKAETGLLARLPRLKAIFSLGAGVDHILSDTTLPDVPIVRFVDPDLTGRMSEYIVLQVLMHLRQQRRLDQLQKDKKWHQAIQPPAHQFRVGVMGLGELGTACLKALAPLGFQLKGWARSKKTIEGVETFAGNAQRNQFLKQTDILISLLPHTPATHGMLNKALFDQLATDGPFAAPIVINAGRGQSQIEEDIIAALESGQLYGVSLDVFESEPLDSKSRLWDFENAVLSPHIAAVTDPNALTNHVKKQINRHQQGQALEHVVDREQGY